MKRPLTVLQMLPALDSGGVERGVLEIAEALTVAGHRSLVVSSGGRFVSELVRGGSEHRTKPIGRKSPLSLRYVPWLRRIMRDEQIDVVDIHSRFPGWLTLLAWKSLPRDRRPALVSTVHGLYSPGLYSSIMCRGEQVIAVSQTTYDYIRQYYPAVPEASIRMVHRGIDPDEFPRGLKPDPNWLADFFTQFPQARGQPLITLPGRITRLKGHEAFLQMLAELCSRGVTFHGLIVGGCEPRKAAYLRQLRTLADQLRLNHCVTFTGHQSNMKQIYASSAIVLSLSSKPEAFGRTVAEALSIGTPVVGFRHGGVAEILESQFPEGAIEVGSQLQLTEKVAWLLTASSPPQPGPVVFQKSDMQEATLQIYESAACR